MGTQNISARPLAPSRNDGRNRPVKPGTRSVRAGGVIHENVRHTTRFTVVGNHLSQHAELSLLAIGLAVHIQSLPGGSPVDIKSLTRRFPEGARRIAAGLRELEAHGYLRRELARDDAGKIVTRTVSCNHPGRSAADEEAVRRAPARRTEAPRRALPAVPQPAYPSPDLLRTGLGVLAGLRHEDPRLHLSATETEHLAPGVAAWLERDLTPEAVRRVLTCALPLEPLRRPAALLAHRLSAQLPPPPLGTADPAPPRHPLQNCDTCDLAFRGPEPGTCEGCRRNAMTT
ncbi:MULTISPECIES: DNA-binding protein [unclassified Streptomyces]|uniref:DNA-binding protein n=1 Tax=unclassified Streptomyces TaxID=2593676 RepID=UPI0006AF8918|nr:MULTISPECIES: DNA-binding protein [unclassified Streptomyces]KOX23756.1 DNA-binding protein [Streptomyces sp. NRRL F-6491]KOX40742.1 DNA-binding protein [Streptomyces sp. NRRL F-6492]